MRLAGDDRLCASEALLRTEMLHAMGQPLTVLGLCRLMVERPDLVTDGALREVAEQVERVTELYQAVRLLQEGGRGLVDLSELLPEWRRRAAGREVRLTGGEAAAVNASSATGLEERVAEGLFGAALRSCGAGGKVDLAMQDGWLELRGEMELGGITPWGLRVAVAVEGDGVPMVIDAGAKLSRAEDVSAGGGVVYRLQPFHARVRLHRV